MRRLWHRSRRNSRRGSRRNILEHYDIGNAFFAHWLDPTMTYSCGYYETPEASLEAASRAKLDRICRKLDLRPSDRVIEIGGGWGSFALHAASAYGCHVTTTTISREQYALACTRVAEAGLEDRVDVLLADYRDLAGTFDKLVSIEMVEAVGHEHHTTFFGKCAELLRPSGRMALQAITIADHRYDLALRAVDFIQRHVFPGSCLLSEARLRQVADATGLCILDVEDITPHYVRTLQDWTRAFQAAREPLRALGHPERFLRMWEFYLAYCEGGFAERHIGDVQVVLAAGSAAGGALIGAEEARAS